jgi:hypothetical protein
LNFAGSINGISDEIFSNITYIPNIIFELTNFSYDSVNNSTNITRNTYFETTSINTNLNVGSSLNVDRILSQEMLSNTIQVNDLNCRNLKLNNCVFNEVIAYFYINSVSLPLIKSNLISNFNIQSISALYFTLKNGYRIDIVDSIYYQQIPYSKKWLYIINKFHIMHQCVKSIYIIH